MQTPAVECIAKGKAHKKYEFGCKVSVVTTCKDNWIVGVEALHNSPFDGHTLKGALQQAARLVGWIPKNAYCGRGDKGNPKHLSETAVHLANRRKSSMTRSEWCWFKRRSAIEPVIGHIKQDKRMGRNYLKGIDGDKMNAILAGCGLTCESSCGYSFGFFLKSYVGSDYLSCRPDWTPWPLCGNNLMSRQLAWVVDFKNPEAKNRIFQGRLF
ncbi:hypothetical protein EDC39_1065 [Geothermobacter ehrlichii]|uniref:DDE family transposase n=1 Tax=Geothermobacter ehrlichii TaxID=213224 RepID=A0A5D3WKF4_9BACT|nr:hypothetical protein EDC39_1065 [Geothermobacter ehrlichii]